MKYQHKIRMIQLQACRQRLYYDELIHGVISIDNILDRECICYIESIDYERTIKELEISRHTMINNTSYIECMLMNDGTNIINNSSIRVYVVPVEERILRQYDVNYTAESIYISPKILNFLQILGNNSQVMLQSCVNDSDTANEVIISRIKGLRYPASNDVENLIIKRYFSIKRLLNVGDVVAIPTLSMDQQHPPMNAHDVDDLCVHYYCVYKLVADDDSNKTSAVNIPETSKLILQGLSVKRLPDIAISTFIAALDLRDYICKRWQHFQVANTLPDAVAATTLYPPLGYFIHSCKSLLVTDNDEYGSYAIDCKSSETILVQRGLNLSKSGYFPGAVYQLYTHYARLMSVTGNTPLQVQLMTAPLLLRSPLQADDILPIITSVAARLGLPVYIVDCILLNPGVDINDDTNVADIVSSGFLCTDVSTPYCTYVSSLDAAELKNRPGLVYLDNLDYLLDILDEQQEKGAAYNVDQSKILGNIVKLQRKFEKFFTSLYADVDPEHLYNECVCVLASTQVEKRQGSITVNKFLRDVFVVEMNIAGYESEQEVVSKLHEEVLIPEKYSYTGDTINKLAKQIYTDGGGISSMHRIASKCIYKALSSSLREGKAALDTLASTKLQLTPIDALIDSKKTKRMEATFKGTKVSWDDIGGLEHVKKEIINVLQLPLLHPELFPPGAPVRRGVLLFGPPGTGKTMLAKAVASECNISFISVKGPELLDPYIGESEKNIRDIFQKALVTAPCVLFFDELDSLAARRGGGGSSGSGGVMDRIVSQLLTELDRVFRSVPARVTSVGTDNKMKGVYFIGATNRPDLLDPGLMRKGRLDLKIYLPVNRDASNRLKVLSTCCRKVTLSSDVNLTEIANSLPDITTGADISSIVSQAHSHAMQRKIDQLLRDYYLQHKNEVRDLQTIDVDDLTPEFTAYVDSMSDQELDVSIAQQDLLQVSRVFKPSVSAQDLEFYDELGKKYSDL